MKIVDTKAIAGRRRRTYSPEFKREIVVACRKAGASVAGVALFHGINANVVHRWLREAAQEILALPSPAFVPVAFDLPAAPEAMAAEPSSAEIRIEVERGESRIVVRWPLAGAAECAAWLSEWLA
jgi:transposase